MFTIYDNTNALPQNTVTWILQDHQGYLWVGTEEGACRFDGNNWKVFNLDNNFTIGAIWSMGQDVQNRYWFGTLNGIWCLELTPEGANWQNFTPPDLPDTFFYTFYRDDKNRLWFGARSGAYCLDLADGSNIWHEYLIGKDNRYDHVYSIGQDWRGWFWFATQNGVKVLEQTETGDIWHEVNLPEAIQNQPIISLYIDKLARIWLGTTNNGVVWLDTSDPQATWQFYTTDDGLLSNYIMYIIDDRAGRIWFGTGEGVSRLDFDKGWQNYTKADGLPHDHVSFILEDLDGRFWFGTQGGGLACYDQSIYPRLWKTYRVIDGLVSDDVTAVTQDDLGRFWIATRSGVSCFDEQNSLWKSYTAETGLPHSFVWAAIIDRQGRIWLGTRNGLAYRTATDDTEDWKVFAVVDGLVHEHVNHIFQDSKDRLWISTFGGISCLIFEGDDLIWKNYTHLPRTVHRHIYEDTNGWIWFSTSRGAVYLDNTGQWGKLSVADGMAEDNIKCLFQDSRGWYWFGTQSNGISLYDAVSGSWTTFNRVNGLPNNTIYAIVEDKRGFIWFSTNRGVCRLNLENQSLITFDRTAGLANDEANILAVHQDKLERLWFGTVGGLSVIEATKLPENISPCNVQIDNLKIMGLEQRLSQNLEVENSEYDLIFEYGAIEFTAPHRVLYRFQLVGLERDWSAPTFSRSVRYTNLHPGEYTFAVQAKNWGGQWSVPAEYSFRVILSREEQRREEERQSEKEAFLRMQIEKQILQDHNSELARLNTELQRLNSELQKLNAELERQAREDGLTGLLNRRYFELELAKEYERAVRYERPITVVMVDIDNFKLINDNFSHLIGDQVLKTIADILRQNRRANDIVARYGGEELVLVFPETSLDVAAGLCERLRKSIETFSWRKIHRRLKVTVSMGLASDTSVANHEKLLALADEKLYEAKRAGKNKISY
jgi:diguanylate cyclase (GGDEF)-like protein